MSFSLKSVSTEELSGIVTAYPWFAAARKELCERLAKPTEAALYVSSRSVLSRTVGEVGAVEQAVIRKAPQRKVYATGGDYFSQEDYDAVRSDAAAAVPGFKPVDAGQSEGHADPGYLNYCTETLAQIYAEQGYYEQAAAIYSKLSLRYPEKSVYFAALMQKLNEEINN